MISRVSDRIIKDGREAIIEKALLVIQKSEPGRVEDGVTGIRDAMRCIFDFIFEDQRRDIAEEELRKSSSYFMEIKEEWESISSAIKALGSGVMEYLRERGGDMEPDRLYSSLIEAQKVLFEEYLDRERHKRERLGKYQREIDRFPETIAAILDPPTLAKMGMEKLKVLVSASEGTLCVVDSKHGIVPQYGDHVPEQEATCLLTLEGKTAELLLEKGEPYWEAADDEDSCLRHFMDAHGLASVLLLPLAVRGRTIGIAVISDGPRKRTFTPEEIEIGVSFSSRMAVAMENARLHSREQYKIKETVALLEIARAVNSTLDLHEILDKVVQMTVDLCGVVMCVVYLLNDEAGRFIPGAYHGFIEDSMWEDERNSGFSVSSLGYDLLAALSGGEHVILPSRNQGYIVPSDVMYEHGVDLVLMFPLSSKERMNGLFALFYPHKAEEFEREEIEVMGTIAAQASLAIENASLYEDIEKSYFSTVKALAKAIEVKDPYTHGHSERVTEYALMIAESMKLDEREKQKLKYAATLHDIGKIGIAGRVLNKAGALTDEEYMHVKTHPLLGDTIIEPVEFLQGPRPIILHHHERYDGKGYPDGLKGTSIPLCARILAVADAFEAMRSDRPYRKALSVQAAREELKKNAGTQFDPEVVKLFLEILESCGNDPVTR